MSTTRAAGAAEASAAQLGHLAPIAGALAGLPPAMAAAHGAGLIYQDTQALRRTLEGVTLPEPVDPRPELQRLNDILTAWAQSTVGGGGAHRQRITSATIRRFRAAGAPPTAC